MGSHYDVNSTFSTFFVISIIRCLLSIISCLLLVIIAIYVYAGVLCLKLDHSKWLLIITNMLVEVSKKGNTLWYIRVHLAVAIFLITSGRNMLHCIFSYYRETRQMPETIKQKALQLEPILGSNGACKFSIHFLWRSRSTTSL